MNKQYMINQICQYVLDQNHEREDLFVDMINDTREMFYDPQTSIKQIRETLYAQRTNSIWYLAIYLADGAKEANKAYRGMIAESIEYIRNKHKEYVEDMQLCERAIEKRL